MSVGLMVCSFTVTVDISMVVVGTLILNVASCDLGICNQRTKISAEIRYYRSNNKPSLHSMSSGKGSLYPAQLWAEMLTDSIVLYVIPFFIVT